MMLRTNAARGIAIIVFPSFVIVIVDAILASSNDPTTSFTF